MDLDRVLTKGGDTDPCVEIRFDDEVVHIRDTKDNGTGPIITVPISHWPSFLTQATSGGAVDAGQLVRIDHRGDGETALHATNTGTTLTYTAAEWTAFIAGAIVGEFDLSAGLHSMQPERGRL